MPSTRNPALAVVPGPGLIPTGVVTSSSVISGAGGGSEADLLAHINDPVGAHAGSAISVDDTSLTAVALLNIDVKSGGVGKDALGLDAQEAFNNIDLRLTRLRGFVGTISDNVNSFGGDHDSNNLDTIVDPGGGGLLGQGVFSIRQGSYTVTNTASGWSNASVVAVSGSATRVLLGAGRAQNLSLTASSLTGVGLGTTDSTYRYAIIGGVYLDLHHDRGVNFVEAGSLLVDAPGSAKVVLRGIVGTGNASLTTATNCLEITNGGIIDISDCMYGGAARPSSSTITSKLSIHDFLDPFLESTINIRNCSFHVSAVTPGASSLLMADVRAPTRFTNCHFILFGATGDSWALSATNCHSIVFDNCIFSNDLGQVIRCVNSGITFIDCQFTGGATTTLANPQLICGEGYVSGTDQTHKLRFIRCIATFGAANVRASGAPSLPIIELGGHGVNFSGSSATLTWAASVMTVTGLAGMTPDVVGSTITISASAANNGSYVVTDYLSATSVKYFDAGGSTDANNGTIDWSLVNVPTAFTGQVEVEGLSINAVSGAIGVHNNTTVVLHDHPSNRAPNRYAGVTVDMKGNNPLNTGTLGSYGAKASKPFNSQGQGCVIEIVGAETATIDSQRPKLCVENLQVLHVGSPATLDVPRGVLRAAWCDIQGLVVDGSGASAFSYTYPVTFFVRAVEVNDFQMFPTAGVPVDSGSSSEMITLWKGCRLTGLRYHHRNSINWSGPGAAWPLFLLATDAVLRSAFVYIDVDVWLAKDLIRVDSRSKVEGSTFITQKLNGATQHFIQDFTGNGTTIVNNLFQWTNVAATGVQAANITGNFAVVMGNQFLTEGVVVGDMPTTVVSGANVLDINILGYGAPAYLFVEVY